MYIKNENTKEYWSFFDKDVKTFKGFAAVPIYLKFYSLFYIVGALLVLSFSTAIYTKIVTFLSPLILYSLSKPIYWC